MGKLVKGIWHDVWYDTKATKGEFKRAQSQFRNWITADGSAGPTGQAGFKAEPDRYHLYISLACPWAHRTLIFRKLKHLEDIISLSIVHPDMLENGWEFKVEGKSQGDDINRFDFLHQIYSRVDPEYSGRVTVPILWDKKTGTIVSNESSEIIRMFNSAFVDIADEAPDYCPQNLRDKIDAINAIIYPNVNNGVYRSGFATTQTAYENANTTLFKTLDELEKTLGPQRFLLGDAVTEADWRLFTTLIRFDSVYHGHFKTNTRRIEDYANLSEYLRELYQMPGVAETVDMAQIKRHYYVSQTSINPTQIVPMGPNIDYSRPYTRK